VQSASPDIIDSASEDTRTPTMQLSIRFLRVTAPTRLDERLFAVLHLVNSPFHIARQMIHMGNFPLAASIAATAVKHILGSPSKNSGRFQCLSQRASQIRD
jgi:hypothetical protein